MRSRWFTLPLLALLLAALAAEVYYFYWEASRPKENGYDPYIVQYARENGIDPFLIRALIWRESKFDPTVHGTADERGLMQVTPDAGEMWAKANKIPNFNPDNLYDPITNIRAGTWYLTRSMRLWNKVDDPVPFALAEYNAGRKNALKWVDPDAPFSHASFVERITFPTTRKYVDDIMDRRDKYRLILGGTGSYRDYPAQPTP